MKCTTSSLQHSRLIELIQIAENATPGTWQAITNNHFEGVVKCIPDARSKNMIADCMKNELGFKRDHNSHIYLIETLGENAKGNAIFIGNFHPELANLLIKELLNLGNIISKIYTAFDAFQLARIDPDFEQSIRDTLETDASNSNLVKLLQITEAATPGPWRPAVKAKGEHDDIVRTSWTWPRNRCVRDKNGKRIPGIKNMSWKKCGFKISTDGHIYLYESQEDQHIANATYVANFHPGVVISLIEKLINYREIISKLHGLLGYTKLAALGDSLVIHNAIEMSKK